MALRYKIDVMSALKEAGYNTNRIRKEKLIGESMLQKIRKGEMPSWAIFDLLCEILNCQPSDLIECVNESENSVQENKSFREHFIYAPKDGKLARKSRNFVQEILNTLLWTGCSRGVHFGKN